MLFLKRILVSCILALFVFSARADEGMWLPQLLAQLNEKQMKSMGMKITAADIYNINKGSLKDAIVSFGGFCTGEIISSKGLVITNHHCGFDAVQNHSTLEHNYIRDGFWAKNNGEELPNQGLFVTFIIRIDDVTDQVLKNIKPSMDEKDRQSQVDENIAAIRKTVKKESYQDAFVRAFFEGNKYYLFVTETYKDVRLVGAPPASIGNFGKDTDNWMWPRHTGDFSMFRIYAGKDNKPADYSPDNIPYTPKRALSVSLKGLKEGDFTMVFGFPGRTTEYLPSVAVEQIMNLNDPAKIAVREKALGVIDAFMRKDEQIRIQYAAKYANIENAYKKWQGEVLGLKISNAIDKKKAYEAEFRKRVSNKPEWSGILKTLEDLYEEIKPYGLARDYYTEIISKIELFTIAAQLNSLVTAYEKDGEKGFQQKAGAVKNMLDGFYGEYNPVVDKKLFEALMDIYVNKQSAVYVSSMVKDWLSASGNSFEKLADKTYAATSIQNQEATRKLLEKPASELISLLKNDEVIRLYNDILKTYQSQVQSKLGVIQPRINQAQRTYMEAQMAAFKEKTFYPDANSTLRVTYGNVKGYNPRDAVSYDYYTYLDGVMEKYKPGDYEFDVPEKLITLYKNKDYGRYGVNGKMPVCFIARNHTTGGNSGSPALDAYGNLVGLNFDRVWEGTMSDINYDPSICRNIMVDIRYVLFIIDKYAGAGHLVQEMKLVGAGTGR
ncbi:MAG: S46 family peptidase [Chitinophagaceae bacterium]